MKCGYCKHYRQGKQKKEGKIIYKKCLPSSKHKVFDDKCCKWFNPVDTFLCTKYNERLYFIVCLSNRRNDKGFTKHLVCKKCRQFEQELKPIVMKYWIEGIRPVNPREKKEEKPKRKIKRRKKNKPTRKIKRRKK